MQKRSGKKGCRQKQQFSIISYQNFVNVSQKIKPYQTQFNLKDSLKGRHLQKKGKGPWKIRKTTLFSPWQFNLKIMSGGVLLSGEIILNVEFLLKSGMRMYIYNCTQEMYWHIKNHKFPLVFFLSLDLQLLPFSYSHRSDRHREREKEWRPGNVNVLTDMRNIQKSRSRASETDHHSWCSLPWPRSGGPDFLERNAPKTKQGRQRVVVRWYLVLGSLC